MLGNRGFPEALSHPCVCQASFLMTFAMGGVPHAGSRHIPILEQDLHGLDEPSILDNEVIRDSDNEHYETTCPHMLERPTVQQKEKHEQPMVQGSIPKGPPM